MSWLFLLVSAVGFAFTVNAFLPTNNRVFLVPSFFASWMTIELAGHHLVWQAVATVVFVRLGALDAWPGWVGLALTALSWVGLWILLIRGRRAAVTMREAMEDLIEDTGAAPRVPKRHVFVPFLFRRPEARRIRNVTYSRAGGRTLKLDVYLPRDDDAATPRMRPAIMQIHGGAWVVGDKREQGIPLLGHLAANGWVGFNVNYRLSPAATFPEHLIDLKRALVWIREHADEYGIDPDFIAVTGGSAGGHLTALMGLTANDPEYQPGFEGADTSVQAAVPFYGVYDFTDRLASQTKGFLEMLIQPYVMKAYLADEPEKFAKASPIDRVRADAPPFFVIHGDRDTLAPLADARLFVERLRAVSTQPVVYAELRGAQHAFDIFVSPRTAPVIEGVERFLDGVHRDWLRGLEGQGEGAVAEGTIVADGGAGEALVEPPSDGESAAREPAHRS
ncbi:MAG: alpha/beta hydrolase [Microthrixaceae bacterium]|nr:alpha/beta hydrolase [Microthrixaceae bacterium]